MRYLGNKKRRCNKALKAQQRINKAIEFINNHTHYYDDGEYSGYECEIDGLKLLSILQGEEVNNDEWGRNI